MRLSAVKTYDLVIVEFGARREPGFAIVLDKERGKLKVRPLDAKAEQTVTASHVVGHYARREGETSTAVALVGRIRHRAGVTTQRVIDETVTELAR